MWGPKSEALMREAMPPPDMAATAYDVDRPPLAPEAVEADDPLIGRRIDHFEIRGRLGQGGMGTVYLAHDLSLERPVALKVLRPELASNGNLVNRLVMEARAQARLQHPNVVTIYYIGSHQGAPYFAMEYVRGQPLSDHLEEKGPLPWPEALEHIIQTTRALIAAHNKGIVHRDIKPSNLMLEDAPGAIGSYADIKVADFGLAAPVGVAEKEFVGSPYYSAPEQIMGQPPTHRSDMYALGVTFYELLTGGPPFEADNLAALLNQHLKAPRPEIPADRAPWRLRQLITEMMDPQPHNRPWTHEELLLRLEALRPTAFVPGGVAARGMAMIVDLALLVLGGQLIAGMLEASQRLANQMAMVLFAVYYIVAHRYWGKTLGKRLLSLRVRGTTRPLSLHGMTIRFVVTFWGPIVALLMLALQPEVATDLNEVSAQITKAVGVKPTTPQGLHGLLRTMLLPNMLIAIPWMAGFLFPLFDPNRHALHDYAARTRVIHDSGNQV